MGAPLLSLRNLKTYFYTYRGIVKAIDGIDLDVCDGEILGLVGETGCGKSVTALSVLRLIDPPGKIVEGEIWFKGENLLKKNEEEMRKIRGNLISIIFQDPLTYMNPLFTIGDQIAEVILLHQHQELAKTIAETKRKSVTGKLGEADPNSLRVRMHHARLDALDQLTKDPKRISGNDLKRCALEKTVETLKSVRMPNPEKIIKQYPHELSGGMRQRAMIAMSLACNPELLIADEATTFLDVTIQRQILQLLKDLRTQTGVTLIIVTHNLGIVAETCDRVAVMYAGKIVENVEKTELFDNPLHPYTVALLKSIPKPYQDVDKLETIPGSVPDLVNPPSGCRFNPRCKSAKEICKKEVPTLTDVGKKHFVACHLYNESKKVPK
jgi:peptide/nickel transport system ATP-binding protein